MVKVKSVLKRSPITVEEDVSLRDAAKKMVNEKVGLLVVVQKGKPGNVVGVVSERDILRAFAQETSPEAKISSIATRDVIKIELGEDLSEAAKLMVTNNIRHLVVVDEAGALRGVISIRDIIGEKHLLEAIKRLGEEEIPGGD